MAAPFMAVPAETEVLAELTALSPANPFATPHYFESRRQLGYVAWVLGVRDGDRLASACGAFLSTGKLNRTLEIPSLPAVGALSPFWGGLREFCRHHAVTKLELGTFGSPPGVEIPTLGTHLARRNRFEFVIDLRGDLAGMLSKRHKYSVKKGQKAGVETRRSNSAEALTVHQALMNLSSARRRDRGEAAGPVGPSPEQTALLKSGAGELYQAVLGDTVLSSVLLLRAPEGAYDHSSGSSPEGMAVGASPFLVHSIALQLRAGGATSFNLGGAGADETGLAFFKEGFGARRVPLPAASCYIGPGWRRGADRAIALARATMAALPRLAAERVSQMMVYSMDTGSITRAEPREDLVFRALSPEEVHDLAVGDDTFREQQRNRLSRFGTSHAYAVVADGQVAHVSWLLPASAMKHDPPRVIRARTGTAEITACETLPEFRGRGIYPFAIRNLAEVARGQGVGRVWMKTAADNRPSQVGIERAGLTRVGTATLILLPISQRLLIWRRFR